MQTLIKTKAGRKTSKLLTGHTETGRRSSVGAMGGSSRAKALVMMPTDDLKEVTKAEQQGDTAELWNHYRVPATKAAAESALVNHYLPLVKTVVGRLQISLPSHVDPEDLYSAGLTGLLAAVRHYNPKLGSTFETYARVRVRGSIVDELRRMDWVPRSVHNKAKKVQNITKELEQRNGRAPTENEVAAALGISMDDYHHLLQEIRPATFVCLDAAINSDSEDSPTHAEALPDTHQLDPLEETAKREMAEILVDKLAHLPEMQRKVLALYYFEDLRLREIAEAYGLTESRICQIHSQAILNLRGHLQEFTHARG